MLDGFQFDILVNQDDEKLRKVSTKKSFFVKEKKITAFVVVKEKKKFVQSK